MEWLMGEFGATFHTNSALTGIIGEQERRAAAKERKGEPIVLLIFALRLYPSPSLFHSGRQWPTIHVSL